jgi:predicted house-cleaning noncanonical NTP pyrophosphatase (MazG superfamily)
MRVSYNKLVRDRIPEIIAAEGRQYEIEVMAEQEYRQALLEKLVEEALEVSTAATDDLEKEIADLYEVVDALIDAFSLSREMIQNTQQERRSQRGGLKNRIRLLWAEMK